MFGGNESAIRGKGGRGEPDSRFGRKDGSGAGQAQVTPRLDPGRRERERVVAPPASSSDLFSCSRVSGRRKNEGPKPAFPPIPE